MISGVTEPETIQELPILRGRLQEADETLNAIRTGAVDSIVVDGPGGKQVFTLQGAEHPYRVLAETMSEGVANLARDGTILFCNRRLAELLSSPLEQVFGTRVSDHISPGQSAAFEDLLTAAQKHTVRREFDCGPTHDRSHVLFSLSPMATGQSEGICLVATDTTEYHRMKMALEHNAARLRRSNEDLSQFAFIVSHDLQHPLRHIISFARLLQKQCAELRDEGGDYLRRIVKSAERMSQLLDSLLRYSRVCSRQDPAQAIQLGDVLKDVLTELSREITESGARIRASTLPRVQAPAFQMLQLLQNLMSNALKFHAPGAAPDITIGCKALANGWWEISVQDRGIGFDSEQAKSIFQPFRRLHGEDFQGHGMGLAICHRIVNSYGGTIRASSKPGHGSTFCFTVPAAGRTA